MEQYFRGHQQFQLLRWIDALSRGYESSDHWREPADEPLIDEPHRTPTVSNLAYYLLTKAKYNKETLEDRFTSQVDGGTPKKDVFTAAKRDITRHLTQYPGDLFTTKTVKKSAEDHPTFDAGLESRCVEAKAYYLTKHGQDRLAFLTDLMKFKDDLVKQEKVPVSKYKSVMIVEEKQFLTKDAVSSLSDEVDVNAIDIDSIVVPSGEEGSWEIQTYFLPHINVVDSAQDHTPTVYRE